VENLIKKTEAVMYSRDQEDFSFFSALLFGLSLGYGGIVRLKENLYNKGWLQPKKLPCIVISIGNLSMGGTGKTPMTAYVAELVKNFGYRMVVISRGYKGLAEKRGGIVSNGQNLFMDSKTAGDEPFMLAASLKGIPVVVGKNRFKAGMLAVKEFAPDVIILDDAFQHLKLDRDINLLLLDCNHPFGNNRLIPRGVLREPVSSLLRSDAIIATRTGAKTPDFGKQTSRVYSKPFFKSSHLPYICRIIKGKSRPGRQSPPSPAACDPDYMSGRNVFAFAGIAKNNDFINTLEHFNCNLAGYRKFSDHHRYTKEDLDALLKSAKDLRTDIIVTTQKDYTRIAGRINWPVDLVVIDIKISFKENEAVFAKFIKKRLAELA